MDGTGASTDSERLGMLQWFHFEDYTQVERAIADLRSLGITELRTGFSWADWCRPQGQEWFDWLLPRLAAHFRLLPCFTYTPPGLGRRRKTNSPPRKLERYAQFLDEALSRYGHLFAYVELWNEPNNDSEWNSEEDKDQSLFSQMIIGAAKVAHAHGKRVVLAGMCDTDHWWLEHVAGHGLLAHIDVVGAHCFPGTWDPDDRTWEERIAALRTVLSEHASAAPIWITEVGSSTLQGEEEQVRRFQQVLEAPVERIYWYTLYDLSPARRTVRGGTMGYDDKHEYHMGIKSDDGTPKLLFREWHNVLSPTPKLSE